MAGDGVRDEFLKDRFLSPTAALPWDLLNEFQLAPRPTAEQKQKLYRELHDTPSLLSRTTVRFKRGGIGGLIEGFEEKFDLNAVAATASASMSMNRQFTAVGRNKMGTSDNLPFQPGGFAGKSKNVSDATRLLHKDSLGLFDIPQGFQRGLNSSVGAAASGSSIDVGKLDKVESEAESDVESETDVSSVNTETDTDISAGDADDLDLDSNDNYNDNDHYAQATNDEDEINKLLPSGTIVRPTRAVFSAASAQQKKKEWAHIIDLDHEIENFEELIPNPARTWPFKLDTFQQEAVYHLEKGDSVFIAAHTSAGKTVVAEYAIAMAHNNMTKAIYTSPIKALSNQKFRDFKETFDNIDVGVITGDVQINPDANCLIMTTEILRSMLYRGADIIRDVEFVIFDEVHYVNDIDRGVVWEEVIIMLPDHVKIILLSATVPNTLEFASWVGRTKKKDIYVISTPKRPVPLEIFVFAKDTPYKLIDANRNFIEKGFNDHVDKLENKKAKQDSNDNGKGGARGGGSGAMVRGGGRGRGRGGGGFRGNRGGSGVNNFNNGNNKRLFQRDGPNSNTWKTLVNYLRKNELLPAVIFVFSKKRCEEYAETLGGINFSTGKEESEIHMFIEKAVSRLKKEDRELPQIIRMREMLKRGIAVHHGGLLPIVKEVVEILFAKSLIKVLFATETFAMGLNLPTRTVIFSQIRKHDGTGFRNLLPGEFTQMAGRAGRRGLDKIGTVMVMAYNQPLEKSAFKSVALGTPTKLSSQFRLTYSMILNLLRIEALRVEEMIKRSFSENNSQSMLPEQQIEVVKLEKELSTQHSLSEIENGNREILEGIYEKMACYRKNYSEMLGALLGSKQFNKFMKHGRLLLFRDERDVLTPAVVFRPEFRHGKILCLAFDSKSRNIRRNAKSDQPEEKNSELFFHANFGRLYIDKWFSQWKVNRFEAVQVSYETIEFISKHSIDVMMNTIDEKETQDRLSQGIKRFAKNRHTLSEMDCNKYMNTENIEIINTHLKLVEELQLMMNDNNVLELMSSNDNYHKIVQRMNIIKRIDTLKQSLNDENLELLPEYNKRLDVLKELDYVDEENMTVNLKGRVACEINSGWELIITELVFDNFLGDFTCEEIVALLSCFVFDGKKGNGDADVTQLYTPRLEKGKKQICKIVEKLLVISTEKEIQLTAEEEGFLEIDRFALVNTVYEWARGQTFKEIMDYANDADESEGTIVRVITFLDEICRQVKNAAMIIGDSDLHSKMTEAQEKIKRDIVFCASLYL
ncbi:SKI complex RNA helicase subunit [Martiniozyma asiatica (nom. inval.)]|nr:SKI complex RNA helicase subunit [Martiniozyma asiatica]